MVFIFVCLVALNTNCPPPTAKRLLYFLLLLWPVSGESPPSLTKELTSSLSPDISFDIDSQFPLDDLKIDPLTLDGLHMLNDPDIVLADAATEEAFRLDRL